MNARTALYIQAIRGPVLLVTAGVLFAIHQAGVLSFSRTWPLLVIVIGVMKLLERAWAPATATWQTAPHAYRSAQAFAPRQEHATSTNAPDASAQPPQGPGGMKP
jgi:hypothetical protein